MPPIIGLAYQVLMGTIAIISMIRRNKETTWIERTSGAIRSLRLAKTPEAKEDAEKLIRELMGEL